MLGVAEVDVPFASDNYGRIALLSWVLSLLAQFNQSC